MTYGRQDAIPEHFDRAVRLVIWSVTYHVPELEPQARRFREALTKPGPITLFQADQLGWTQSDLFVRLTKTNSTDPTHLEILASAGKAAGLFASLTFPHTARLLLVRDNSELKIPEALLLWRDDQSVGHIGMVRLGSSKPTIVAKDHIKKVFLYPDRTKIYGYSDHAGLFHPLSSEQHSSGVSFWLDQIKRMEGVEEFYLLNKERYAVVKRNSAATGPEAVILERRGSTAARLEHLCRTNAPIESVIEGPNSLLFVPKETAGDKLAVYLHDGPFASMGKGGDWIIDMIVQSGTPVLAVNYFGSSSRIRELAVAREIAPMLATDIEQAAAFAQGKLSGKETELVFVAQGFGSLAGFSAMMAGAAWPDRFVVLSGVTEAGHVFRSHVPDRDPFELNYLSRAGRELGRVMNPTVAAGKGTRFLFIHGDQDDKVPHADTVRFVRRLNEAGNGAPAELLTIRSMPHSPEAKPDYQEIVEAVEAFLRRP